MCSCSQNKTDRDNAGVINITSISEWKNSSWNTVESPKLSTYNIIAYYDSTYCTSCFFSLEQWQRLVDEFKDKSLDCSIILLFSSNLKREIRHALSENRYFSPIGFGSADSLFSSNNLYKRYNSRVFLTDSTGEIIDYGNPLIDPEIKWRYINRIGENKDEYLNSKTSINFNEKEIDLGTFPYKERIDTFVNIKNVGKNPLLILSVSTSCNCTVADYDKKPVQPGDSIRLNISYLADKPTTVRRNIIFYYNGERKKGVIKLKGNAV